ncbi:MAG TPA: alcohol dehydrogenase catalytic domain-containing protein, partial [Acidimicrobiia bacterium]|nr:alcohol dehydrogenase catalytic domain-containing protein [Acidimicrobiia bacterium]
MRAAVYVEQDQPLIIEEMTPLDPGPGDVVVEIGASGVCHSDLSATNGTLPLPPPTILGHEGVGTIDWVGSEVSQVKKGDRVIGTFIPSCGACWYCTHDQSNLCEQTGPVMMTPRARRPDGTPIPGFTGLGTFADSMTISEAQAVKVETDLPDDQLALLGCGVTTGVG